MCRALSCDSHSKPSSLTPRGNMNVDLSKLDMPALVRYWWMLFLIHQRSNYLTLFKDTSCLSKWMIVGFVQAANTLILSLVQVIVGFVQAAKRMKKACKWKPKDPSNCINYNLHKLTKTVLL